MYSKQSRWLTLGFGVAALLAVFFALRLIMNLTHWNAPPTDPELRGWMTPRFVARAWNVPPEVMIQELSLGADGQGRRMTLEELAASRDLPLEDLIDQITDMIADHRQAQ